MIEYEYGGDALLRFKYQGQLYIYLKNLQGDITHIYDMDRVLRAKYDYDAWGNVVTTNYVGDIGDINPFRYRGYYYDVETELYYLQSRYYDPETGRFINADDISYLNPKTINGLNLYAYCENNPVMLTDSTGNSPWSDFWKGVGDWFVRVGNGIANTATSAWNETTNFFELLCPISLLIQYGTEV